MLQEPAQELLCGEGHAPGLAVMGVVLPAKGDVVAIHQKKPMIRNRHPMGVAGQVLKDVLWPAKGCLGVNDPLLSKQSAQESRERLLVGQGLQRANARADGAFALRRSRRSGLS
jgi:hypothetical protein